MAQSDSVIEALKHLCCRSCKSTTGEFQDQKKLYSKVFSILLKLNSGYHTCSTQENPLQFSNTDYIHYEIFSLQLSNKTQKAQKLANLVHMLEDRDGHLCDDTASCLKFVLCLSKFSSKEKCKDIFQYADSFEANKSSVYTSSFQYKSYPSSLFEESHYPSLENSKYSFSMFESVNEKPCNSIHKQIFSKMKTMPAYGCFGALKTLPRRNHLNVKLELPLLSESNLDRPTFYTAYEEQRKISLKADDNNSEDEGFVDPQIDNRQDSYDATEIWERACKLQPRNCLSWENQQRHACKMEKLFLSHSGPESTRAMRISHQQNLHFLDPSLQPSVVKTFTSQKLLTDCTHLLLAVESETFQYDKSTKSFVMQSDVQIPGLTPESMKNLLIDLMECGTFCKRLEILSTSADFNKGGRLVESFKEGLRQYLQYYRGAVLYVSQNHGYSLLQLHFFMSNLIRQIRYICEMCLLGNSHKKNSLPVGLKLLDYLYQQCLQQWGGDNYLVLLFLLKITSTPYVSFLQDWLFEGICNDPFGEFNIKVNNQYVSSRNENFWTKGFRPVKATWIAPFLKETATIVACGKALNLLRICCPKHCLYNGQQKRPMLFFSLSKKRLARITEISKDYLVNMTDVLELEERIKKALEDKKKIEEFKHTLEARHAATARYRLQRELKKETLEQRKLSRIQYGENLSQQIRDQKALASAAIDKEKDESPEDLSHIELQLMDDVVDHYAKLIDDANLQQQKFEWQAKRFLLHEKRRKFFKAEEKQLLDEAQEGGATDYSSSSLYVEAGSAGSVIDNSDFIEEKGDADNAVCDVRIASAGEINEKIDLSVPSDDRAKLVAVSEVEDLFSTCCGSENLSAAVPDLKLTEEVRDIDDEVNYKNTNAESETNCDAKVVDASALNDDFNPGAVLGKEPLLSKAQPYKVDYTALTSSPSQDFIKHLPKAAELFSYFSDDQEDSNFLQKTPLPILLSKSFYPVIHAQAKLVNKAVLDYVLHDLKIVQHFNALRNYFFFQDGEFGQTLSQLLFNKMHKRNSYDIFNPFTLSSILNEALSSSVGGESKYSDNLTFVLGSHHYSRNFTDFEMLENLELLYKVDWPLNLIITDSSMESYNKVWRFLLYIKHLLWTLMNTWHCMKHSDQFSNMSSSWQYRKLQIYRHEMQHFVRAIQNFIACEMLQITWLEFEATVTQKVATVDELIDAHNEYLRNTCKRCLLTKEAKPVMKFVEFLFDLVLKFHLQISNLPLTWNTEESDSFERLCKIYDDFKECSKKLLLVLKSSVNTRPQQQIVDFLVMLDLSNQYGSVLLKNV